MREEEQDTEITANGSSFRRDVVLILVSALLAYWATSIFYYKSAEDALENARLERSIEMYRAYENMSDRTDSASLFLRGKGGSASDLNAVFRHFRELSTLVVEGDADAQKAAMQYAGRLSFWGKHFVEISAREEPRFEEISVARKAQMEGVGEFLLYLSKHNRFVQSGGVAVEGSDDSELAETIAADALGDSETDAYREYAADSAGDAAEGAADAVNEVTEAAAAAAEEAAE